MNTEIAADGWVDPSVGAGLRVLHVAPARRSFFDQQIRVLEEHGVECTVLTPRGEGGLRSHAGFYRRVLDAGVDRYDLVHVSYGPLAPFGLAQPTRPVVLTLWGTEFAGRSPWLDRATAAGIRYSDAVIVPSVTVGRELSRRHDVVPFGIDTELFRPIPRRDAREQLGWDPDARIVLFPYDPKRPVKDHDRARRVVSRLDLDPVPELKTVCGRPYEEMPLVMNASDVVLITSRYESGPVVVKEAAACNVPVVSTDVGFAREVLRDVENSYVVDGEDGLVAGVEAALDGDRRSTGRAVVGDFELSRMAEELLSVYDRVVSDR
ncbi:glycosyltransferase family 4 protein [Natronorarus salvus]|uniref:glycosyltransferase family 4 protein n=1 Tax=Natronorarus salvus TaxID=3117733 RepID=UPI002F26256A